MMPVTIAATFVSNVDARNAIEELTHFGLKAADISVAEGTAGDGTVFGTAQTLSPGRGSTDVSTILQFAYPLAASGGMPGGIVATTHDDVLLSLMDFGLSETAAVEGAAALEVGSVLMAVTVDDMVAKAMAAMMERHSGKVIE